MEVHPLVEPDFSENGQRLFVTLRYPPLVKDTLVLEEEFVDVEIWDTRDGYIYPQQEKRLDKNQKGRAASCDRPGDLRPEADRNAQSILTSFDPGIRMPNMPSSTTMKNTCPTSPGRATTIRTCVGSTSQRESRGRSPILSTATPTYPRMATSPIGTVIRTAPGWATTWTTGS